LERHPRRAGRFYEHLLFWRLANSDWYVVRAPGSGAGSSGLIYPDIVAVKPNRTIAIELKARPKGQDVYLERERYRKLAWIRDHSGAQVYVCTYYSFLNDFRCLRLEDYSYETDRYFVYKRVDFTTKGLKPEELG